MRIPTCGSCHQEMVLVKKGRSKNNVKHKRYRIRRFHCALCNIFTTIFGDGTRDLILEPLEASIKAGNVKGFKNIEITKEKLENNY